MASMARYVFLRAVDYDRNGRRYEVGEEDALNDWHKEDVKAALAAGLVEKGKAAPKETGRVEIVADEKEVSALAPLPPFSQTEKASEPTE